VISQVKKRDSAVEQTLPEIPGKIYFSIGEVSDLCRLKPHVLRYWEQEFPQLSPVKRRGNRRYYQRDDVLLIRRLKNLLYVQGYTLEGAKQSLSSRREKAEETAIPVSPAVSPFHKHSIQKAVQALEDLVRELETNTRESIETA